MNNIQSEKEYQKYILEKLEKQNGFIIRSSKSYDRLTALDKDLLFKFIQDTQPKVWEALTKIYKKDTEDTIVNTIKSACSAKNSSLLYVLKHGIDIANQKLELMYSKPATTFNKELTENYHKNIFSVMEEVTISAKERVDLVIFLNGFPIMTFELKCEYAGQNYENAIKQYRIDRDPKNPLFLFKNGALVNFAMDLDEVHMTTRLEKEKTFFLPFNKGAGVGVHSGKGNPQNDSDYNVSYMWDDILKKDTILELISKFIYLQRNESVDELTGKTKNTEYIIFPRYHQLDVIRKVLADVYVNRSSQNYLIQHSAGSGKTNSIAWLAHRLVSQYDENQKVIFDNIVIVTDRIVVDRQLQTAVLGIEHKSGLIKVMNDKCTSSDLADALKGNTKIIATTIQKFPYIINSVKGLKNKNFAVIIDEAHSSTAGKNMTAVTSSLASDDAQDLITEETLKSGKQPNISIFAFTATPKPTTLKLFGRTNSYGSQEAFHLYSMKQAIEEGFILDVLANYTTYKTYYQLSKQVAEDPKMKSSDAKRQIARFIELHDTNIAQRIEVIVEHFRQCVMSELGGKAKAMVVTASREGAVKYQKALEAYIARKGYNDIHTLVAFSGKVTVKEEDKEYTEAGINGFTEGELTSNFNTDKFNVLLVANKYQTGFDQPKLCAMYILKTLKGVTAVQTLSRLNRIFPPFDKKTFILDFVNGYEDIIKSFEPFYTTTILSNTITPNSIYELEQKIDGFYIIREEDVEILHGYYLERLDVKDKEKFRRYVRNIMGYTKKRFEDLNDPEKQKEFKQLLKSFVRLYEFLIQATCLDDPLLQQKYRFIAILVTLLNVGSSGVVIDLDGKLKADRFVQQKISEHQKSKMISNPIVNLPLAETLGISKTEEKKLSEIIAEINSKTGKSFETNPSIKLVLQMKDFMLSSERLKASAKNNTEKDFELTFLDSIDDVLVKGLSHNEEFYSLLLSNEEIKKQLFSSILKDVYETLRNKD